MYHEPILELGEEPLVKPGSTLHDITEDVCRVAESKMPRAWYVAFSIALVFVAIFAVSVATLFWRGIGAWGNTGPTFWAWDITNFVWWVGIGHAGTLISAVLFIFRQRWRTAINRFAEAMTLFAVLGAMTFAGIHVGRPWVIYYLFPLPDQMSLWPSFKSPLLWDVFAVGTYFTVSLLFWFTGLVPDLATMRDRATTPWRRRVFGFFAMGWRGSNRSWRNYERAYLILAGISTPLVISVHSVVAMDFATSIIPGWHTTIFPPYFVVGAVFSGFAMVMTVLLVARKIFKLERVILPRHLDLMNKVILLTSCLIGFAYATEFFIAWYSGNPYELYVFKNRAVGPYSWAYWTMVVCNVIVPQIFWKKSMRTNVPVMWVVSILINVGMWFERFVIIVTSLHRDFLPSSWGMFHPSIVDIGTFTGSIGVFFAGFLLFMRYLPVVAMSEVKGTMAQADPHYVAHHAEPEDGVSRESAAAALAMEAES